MTDRLPSIPLIVNDPYFSIWLPGNTLTEANTTHWSGAVKPLCGHIAVDGKHFHWLGSASNFAAETKSLQVTPTQTISTMDAGGVEISVRFWAPALPDDWDMLSMPVTCVDLSLRSRDGQPHQVTLELFASDRLCYEGEVPPDMRGMAYECNGLHVAYAGQEQQKILGNSGDHITIDWGYLYMASAQGSVERRNDGLMFTMDGTVAEEAVSASVLLGYDDVASINYFGMLCRTWYMRSGKTIIDALKEFSARHDELLEACENLDKKVMDEAEAIGGEDYRLIACAAWRHTFGAHKLIADAEGNPVLLSKENDSNGCIGTVDLSYPSSPLFLKYSPELVNAMCRPIIHFAQMPVWEFDFAPHDVGRYPYATGQVYALRSRCANGKTHPPVYLYPAGTDIYNARYQMPVEECGNMLIMLESAIAFGASENLVRSCLPVLEKWVKYLDEFGEDPGEQLCTDDFAGHLNRNINLAAKAIVGIACYGRLMERIGKKDEAARWEARAHEMADSWLNRSVGEYNTALTFDGKGWSMKYNLAWDLVLGLNLLSDAFYHRETESYLPLINEFGLPLDSRADYTKSDWMVWVASMSRDKETFRRIIAPLAHYLKTTSTRVPFSDWYDTRTGRFVAFIGRSVQGGLYMPLLMK